MRSAAVAVTAVAFLAGCSLGGDDDAEVEGVDTADFVTDLTRIGQEEPEGRVGLTAEGGGKTRVVVHVEDPPTRAVEVDIRGGNCQVIHQAVSYRLSPLAEGMSETVVDVPVRDLRRTAGHMVLVHDSPEPLGGLCGDLAAAQPPGAAPTFD